MRARIVLGLVALLPAALNAAPGGAGKLSLAVCTGDGTARTLTVPMPTGELPGRDQPGCCAKGCHTGSRKKSTSRQIDTGQ